MTTPSSLASIPVHDGIEEWLAAAVTGGLSAEERRLFDDHLADCAHCRELFAEETTMSQTIQNAFTEVRPLPGFERRLTAAFRASRDAGFGAQWKSFSDTLFHRPAVRVLGSVAMVLALITLGGGLTHELTGPKSPELGETVRELIVPTGDASNLPAGVRLGNGPQSGVVGGVPRATKPEWESAAADQADSGTATAGGTSSPSAAPLAMAGMGGSGVAQNHGFGVSKAKAAELGTDAPHASVLSRRTLQDSATKESRDSSRTFVTLDNGKPASGSFSGAVGGTLLKDSDQKFAYAAAQAATAAPAEAPLPPTPQPPASAPPVGTPDNRKLIRNANVELEVASFDPAVDAIGAAATQVGGGYVATVDSSRLANGKRRGTIVIKVLPDNLDAFLARLKELGDVKSQNISTQDITKDYFDTDARLRNARRMEDRLLKILDEDKGKLTEILQVEKELGRVREDIEKMQGELQLYDALVRFATVTIDLYEKDLKQPATFLLRQTAELSLLASDVEKTYAEARHAAEDAHAQIENSDLVRAEDGHVTATLRLLLAPDTADTVIAHLKALARVETFKLTGERVAENGDAANSGTDADTAKLKHGPVTVNLSISHDEETHRRVSLTVTAADTSTAFDKTRAAALAAGGEIVSSDFTKTQGTHGSGVLTLRLPSSHESSLLDAVRALGQTSDLNVQRDNNIAPDADSAPVLLTLNFADERILRHVSLSLVASDLDAAFDKIRAAALAAGGEITNSALERTQGAGASGTLGLRLPARSEAGLLATIRGLGRTYDLTVQRDTSAPGDDTETGPISLAINFSDSEAPVQQTNLVILCTKANEREDEVRKIAADIGAQVRSSTFDQSTNGGEDVALVFALPLNAYDRFLTRVKTLGEVTSLKVHRPDHPGFASAADASTAPVEVSLTLFSRGSVISDDSGLWATVRHTLAQGVAALMWSLRMIGVALAFLAPWVIALLVIIWLSRLLARRRARKSRQSPPVEPGQ